MEKPTTGKSELTPVQEKNLERFREILGRIEGLENLRQTELLMEEIAAGRTDPEDPHVLEAIRERRKELEALQ